MSVARHFIILRCFEYDLFLFIVVLFVKYVWLFLWILFLCKVKSVYRVNL